MPEIYAHQNGRKDKNIQFNITNSLKEIKKVIATEYSYKSQKKKSKAIK